VSALATWSTARAGSSAAIPLLALLISTGGAGWLAARLFLGAGRPEPSRSLAVLGGRVVSVSALTERAFDADCVEVSSARSLRRLADAERLPVLHVRVGDADRFVVLRETDVVELRQPAASQVAAIPALNRLLWQS
jgi:hypothetical protein